MALDLIQLALSMKSTCKSQISYHGGEPLNATKHQAKPYSEALRSLVIKGSSGVKISTSHLAQWPQVGKRLIEEFPSAETDGG